MLRFVTTCTPDEFNDYIDSVNATGSTFPTYKGGESYYDEKRVSGNLLSLNYELSSNKIVISIYR